MPDVFTGVVVLSLWLLGFKAAILSMGECLWLLLRATASVAFHQSHVLLALGLAFCGAALLLVPRGLRLTFWGTARMAAPVVVAGIGLVAVNRGARPRVPVALRFSLPGGTAHLGRPGDGPIAPDLPGGRLVHLPGPRPPRAAPRRLPVRTRRPLWTELGGTKAWAAEASAIVSAVLGDAPGAAALKSAANTLEQFGLVNAGDGLEP